MLSDILSNAYKMVYVPSQAVQLQPVTYLSNHFVALFVILIGKLLLRLEHTHKHICHRTSVLTYLSTMGKMNSDAWKKLFGSEPVEAKANDRRVRPNAATSSGENTSPRAVQDTAELALRLATIVTQKQREDESMLVSAVPIKKSNLVFQAMTAAHAEYLKLAKGRKGHGLGDGVFVFSQQGSIKMTRMYLDR